MKANIGLAKPIFSKELYLEATKEFNAALGDLGDDEMRAKTYNRLGECYLELEAIFEQLRTLKVRRNTPED